MLLVRRPLLSKTARTKKAPKVGEWVPWPVKHLTAGKRLEKERLYQATGILRGSKTREVSRLESEEASV